MRVKQCSGFKEAYYTVESSEAKIETYTGQGFKVS